MTAGLLKTALSFDPVLHEYRTSGGVIVPSVTQILGAVGVSADFAGLGDMSSKLRDQIEYRRQLGSAVHADCHAFDDDDLAWETVNPDVAPFVRAWATLRENQRLTPVTRERVVFHPAWFYGGTLDGIFELPTGKRVLLDLKIGDPEDAGCRFQTAGYQDAYQVEHPDASIDERWGVQLTPEHVIPYRITPYRDWRDVGTFHAFVTTYTHQHAARRRTPR